MRILFFVCCAAVGACVNLKAQNNFTIQNVELKNPGLVKAIEDYLKEFKDDLAVGGVLIAVFDPVNKCYYLSHKMFKEEVQESFPSYYSLKNDRVILIYTGFESELEVYDKSSRELLQVCDKFFVDPQSMFYHAKVWKVTPDSNGYIKAELEKLPLDY